MYTTCNFIQKQSYKRLKFYIYLTNQEQIDLLKDILKKSIELDEEEDEILGDESGNSVPKG